MLSEKLYTALSVISRIILIIILVVSGIGKILDPVSTIEVLNTFNVFTESINVVISSVLPFLEIALAVMLISNYTSKLVSLGVLILFIGFLVVSISGYVLGYDNDCGCFGSLADSSFGIIMVLRNFIFVLLAIIVWKTKIPARVKKIYIN